MSPLEPAELTTTEPDVFPTVGARARIIKRFERDLAAWLATPDGQFAQWRAARAVADPS